MVSDRKLSQEVLREATSLAAEILKNIELSELPLSSIALKASRLARHLGDVESQQMFSLEAGGYSTGSKKLPQARYQLALRAGRRTSGFASGVWSENLVWLESIDTVQQQLDGARTTLGNLREPSAPPAPGSMITPPTERGMAQNSMNTAAGRLASRRQLVYEYASSIYYELRYSEIAEDVFTRLRLRVDSMVASAVPDSVQKFTSVYENLASSNAEDWSNAVHSCRRILQDLADRLSPATDEVGERQRDGRRVQVRYGQDQYINRLMRFIETRSTSERFVELVGSNLAFIGERLDAAFAAAQKGSHSTVTKEEADRFVVYTYLLVGDILSLGVPI